MLKVMQIFQESKQAVGIKALENQLLKIINDVYKNYNQKNLKEYLRVSKAVRKNYKEFIVQNINFLLEREFILLFKNDLKIFLLPAMKLALTLFAKIDGYKSSLFIDPKMKDIFLDIMKNIWENFRKKGSIYYLAPPKGTLEAIKKLARQHPRRSSRTPSGQIIAAKPPLRKRPSNLSLAKKLQYDHRRLSLRIGRNKNNLKKKVNK